MNFQRSVKSNNLTFYLLILFFRCNVMHIKNRYVHIIWNSYA